MRIAGNARVGFFRPSWVYRFFFASDLLCLGIQAAGAGVSTSSNDNEPESPAGKPLLLVGLAGQLIFFGIFAIFVIFMHSSKKYGLRGRRDLRIPFWCLYLTTALLFIRNTYRVIEFAQGWHGYLATTERYFYIFDCLMVVLTFVVYAALHSSIFLPTAPSFASLTADVSRQQASDSMELSKV
mmetsp:Transcript_17651/g.53063  ORF Transcript_17651/g.53063 Transcript_17651/m.53063 type:complete len:183 (-) Transcript_17651:2330-2878(-)